VSYQNEDNFVTNEITVVIGDPAPPSLRDAGDGSGGHTPPPVTPSADGRPPVLTLDEIKTHVRIELGISDEDAYLGLLEMAARLHTENYIRRQIDAAVGEHVKTAMLLLIAHWYRNRETVTNEYKMIDLPYAYDALLRPERAYPNGVY
jgi:hypothetical protein